MNWRRALFIVLVLWLSLMALNILFGTDDAGATTPEYRDYREVVVFQGAEIEIYYTDTETVDCGRWEARVACYWPGPDWRIVIGTIGAVWLRHELRHWADELDNGRVDGSICGANPGFTRASWIETCAGQKTIAECGWSILECEKPDA